VNRDLQHKIKIKNIVENKLMDGDRPQGAAVAGRTRLGRHLARAPPRTAPSCPTRR
jgi:hypothetical protein